MTDETETPGGSGTGCLPQELRENRALTGVLPTPPEPQDTRANISFGCSWVSVQCRLSSAAVGVGASAGCGICTGAGSGCCCS